MATLTNKWFLVFSLIWLIIFTCTKFGIYFYWPIQFYLIDLIAVPIIGNLSLAFYRFILKNQLARLSFWHIAFIVLSLIVVFEWYMPKSNSRYSADIFDVVMYILGGLFFGLVMNCKKSKVR
ncbi:hypothetical protein [Pedobacter cryophilus]|uniref:Magnesium citrate secondary transporter n=1 Tax=Pedobacter cryophilus TaxID=2571271 RepID=A0A4U1BX82_9SPHI|nr:hypothetical protein [Pedobacter cryophilus]TKB96043.1 hypothetical protein FA046_15365 [Pedobacter cryophilus]